MQLKNSSMRDFIKENENNVIVVFGEGIMFQDMIKLEVDFELENRISFIIDNDKKKWGRPVFTANKKWDVFPVGELEKYNASKLTVVITSEQFPEMLEQLDEMSFLEEASCYIYPIMRSFEHRAHAISVKDCDYQIPPIIHYCWFGGAPLSDMSKKCMDTWRRYCPDYEIVRWDESNYDVKKNKYMEEAYKAGAYAYVSDYARLDILYQYGGIYLDTDIELLKPLDELRKNEAYGGWLHHGARIDTGIGFGSSAQNSLLMEFMELYKYERYMADAGVNKALNAASVTRVLKYYGLNQDGSYQEIKGMACYPREFFDPLSYVLGIDQRTEDTYSVHYGNMSWADDSYYSIKNIRKRSKEKKDEIMRRLKLQ